MTVVLGPGWPGILLHEAIGHGLEGDFNRKKTSAFAGLLGQRVASPGVTVVDDFGHHPTAIRETLKALRIRYAKEKIWAAFEPRSNTTRRNVFQHELAASFADANAVIVSQVARLEQLPSDERLNPEKLMQDISAGGKSAEYLPDADAIVAHLAQHAMGGDVVCVFSNGGFDGIHTKLLQRLGRR